MMKQCSAVVFLTAILLGFPILLYAQAEELAKPSIERDFRSQRETVLWSDFRDKVQAILPNYSLEELNQEIAELDVVKEHIAGDLLLSARANYSATVEPDTTTHNFNFVPGVSKKFLSTGTTLAAELDTRLRSVVDGMTTSTITPKFTVTQDLLQNFFGLLSRMSISTAERKLEIAKLERQYREYKIQQSYDQIYLNWILLWRRQEVLLEQLRKSTESLENAQEQRSLNYIDNGQYQQFYNAHLTYRRTLQRNEEQLQQIDQRLARFLGQGTYKPNLAALDALFRESQGELPALAFSDSWIWAISEKSLERLNIVYKYIKWQRLPNLTISASLALETTATYGDAEQPNYSELVPTYGIGIQLSWPVFMRKAKHSIRSLELQLKKLEATLDQQQQDFEIRIAQQRGSHQFLQENYALQLETAKAKAAIYASNQVKYRQARASIRDLLDAEIQKLAVDLELLQTESTLVQQLLDYSYEARDQNILK